ncbi:MAG: hypothetical protein AAFZ74_08985 [Pseudomonadota bacterium]
MRELSLSELEIVAGGSLENEEERVMDTVTIRTSRPGSRGGGFFNPGYWGSGGGTGLPGNSFFGGPGGGGVAEHSILARTMGFPD